MPRALVLVHDLFDEIEAFYTIYRLREMGMDVRVASTELREFRGKNWAATLRPDLTVREALSERWDVVAIPGGYAPDRLRRYDEVKELARRAVEQGGVLVSICHAAWVVISAGLARGRRLTGSRGVWDDIRNAGGMVVDEPYVEDGNVISTRSYSDFPEFWPRLEAKLRGMGMLPGRHPMGPADSREAPNAAARGPDRVRPSAIPGLPGGAPWPGPTDAALRPRRATSPAGPRAPLARGAPSLSPPRRPAAISRPNIRGPDRSPAPSPGRGGIGAVTLSRGGARRAPWWASCPRTC